MANEGRIVITQSPARVILERSSQLQNQPGAAIELNGGSLMLHGSLLENNGTLLNGSKSTVSVTLFGTILNQTGGQIDNQSAIYIGCGGKLDNRGTINGTPAVVIPCRYPPINPGRKFP